MAVDLELIASVKQQLTALREASNPREIEVARKEKADDAEGKIRLAKLLSFSGAHSNQAEGVGILEELLRTGTRISEAQWFLALAQFERGELTQCRKLTTDLALTEPTNRNAEGMLGLLKERYQRDGPIGLKWVAAGAAVGVVVLVAAGVWLWARSPRAQASAASVPHVAPLSSPPPPAGRHPLPAAAGSRHLRFSAPSTAPSS